MLIRTGLRGKVKNRPRNLSIPFTADEKRILIKKTVEIVKGKVPVIINIAEQSTTGAIEAVRKAEEYGANGLMLLPPMRYKADSRETVTYFKKNCQ